MRAKLAAALLAWSGIPWRHAVMMGEENFLSLFEFHHTKRRSEGGGNGFHNLEPMLYVEHRKRTRTIDLKEIAKNKRLARRHEEFTYRMEVKAGRRSAAWSDPARRTWRGGR